MTILHLLAMYGLCFGLMNKMPEFVRKIQVIDRLLSCAYCTGFHSGWLVYFTTQVHDKDFSPSQLLLWASSGAAVCYIADTLLTRLEPHDD